MHPQEVSQDHSGLRPGEEELPLRSACRRQEVVRQARQAHDQVLREARARREEGRIAVAKAKAKPARRRRKAIWCVHLKADVVSCHTRKSRASKRAAMLRRSLVRAAKRDARDFVKHARTDWRTSVAVKRRAV
jgi:hypothetical protein